MKTWGIVENHNGEQTQPDEGRFDWFTNREDAEKQAEAATVEMMNDGDYHDGDGFSVLGFDQNGDCDDSPVADFYIEDKQIYDLVYRKTWGAEG